MRFIYTLLFVFLINISVGLTQDNMKGKHIEVINTEQNKQKELHIKYDLKPNNGKSKLLQIKFKNKTKANLNIDLVVGFYSNGVLLEKADIVDCLKKSFLNNFFRPYHLVETSFKEAQEIEIKILNFYSEQVDECRQTH